MSRILRDVVMGNYERAGDRCTPSWHSYTNSFCSVIVGSDYHANFILDARFDILVIGISNRLRSWI